MSIPDKSKVSQHNVQVVTYPTKLLYILLALNVVMIVLVGYFMMRSMRHEREREELVIALAKRNIGNPHACPNTNEVVRLAAIQASQTESEEMIASALKHI